MIFLNVGRARKNYWKIFIRVYGSFFENGEYHASYSLPRNNRAYDCGKVFSRIRRIFKFSIYLKCIGYMRNTKFIASNMIQLRRSEDLIRVTLWIDLHRFFVSLIRFDVNCNLIEIIEKLYILYYRWPKLSCLFV